jgi:hypothetical protein
MSVPIIVGSPEAMEVWGHQLSRPSWRKVNRRRSLPEFELASWERIDRKMPMIEFLGRNEVATPERLANRFAFGVLTMSDYNTVFVGSPSRVLAANSLALKGNPIRFTMTDNDQCSDAVVVESETHRRETGHMRIICDTIDEVMALVNTRKAVHAITKKNTGYVDPQETVRQINAIYREVAARFNAPKQTTEDRPSAGETMMARVGARLDRIQPETPPMPSHLERVTNQPPVFGRRM